MGRLGLVDRRSAARIAAPLAFLAAVTVAVLLVRSGLDEASNRSEPDRAGRHRTDEHRIPARDAASTASAPETRSP